MLVLPANNTIDKMVMTGEQLRKVFDSVVAKLSPDVSAPAADFLQVSNFAKLFFPGQKFSFASPVKIESLRTNLFWSDLPDY